MSDATGRVPISGCVISYNEADRIADCVRSLSFCDEVLVVDSGSTDGTLDIARDLGARVVVNKPFPGHREQKQLAIELARHDWVFCLDADERAMPPLVERIRALATAGLQGAAYETPRHNHFFGRILRHGLFVPDRKVRLFDRRQARWGGTNPHDKVEVAAGGRVTRLQEGIEHLSYRDWEHHRRTRESFTRIAAQALYDKGKRTNPFDLLVRPLLVVFKSLVLKLGFLDGWRGFAVAFTSAHYTWLKYWRLWMLARRLRRERAAG